MNDKILLKIENLHVEAGEKEILKGVNLEVLEGQTCVLFGSNGSGKSTLLSSIMGYGSCKITSGKITFKGVDITDLPVDERAKMGIGMMMQRPPNVIGVKLGELLQAASKNGIPPNTQDFRMEKFLNRDLNVGFSGGEIKRSELLQLTAQKPEIVLLDEPESGVDLESIDMIGNKIHDLLYDSSKCSNNSDRHVSSLIITHTGQILEYIGADCAYVMHAGKIVCSGRPTDILKDIKENGYGACMKCKMVKM